MTDDHALYRSIVAQPDDDTPRMVYADWLQENDRPEEAEFIRVGCQIESASPEHPQYCEWLTRLGELTTWLATHVPGPKLKFSADLAVSGEAGWWRNSLRGFPRFVEFDGNHHVGLKPIRAMAKSLEEVFDKIPTRWLVVRFLTNDQLAELLRQPILAKLDRLTVQMYSSGEPNDEAARLIAECPNLKNLHGLYLAFEFGEAGADSLGRSETLRRVEQFTVPGQGLSVNAVRAFGRAAWFLALRVLTIKGGMPDPGFEELSRIGRFPRLHTLDIQDAQFTNGAWQAFANSNSFPTLTSLDLASTNLSGGSIATLASSRWLRPSALHMNYCAIGNDGATALASAPWLGSVQTLELSGNLISATAMTRLVSNRELTALKHLDLSNNSVGAGVLRALTTNPALRGLLRLNLAKYRERVARITAAHFEDFLSRLDLPSLRDLSLNGLRVGGRAARLLTADRFASLTRLDLGDCQLTDAAVKAMLKSPALQNLVELRLVGNKLQDSLALLTDARVLPRLAACHLRVNRTSPELRRKLLRRPGIDI